MPRRRPLPSRGAIGRGGGGRPHALGGGALPGGGGRRADAVLLSLGIAKTRLPSPALTRLVAGALVVMAAARFVPVSVVQFYVQGVAGVVALWPLAYAMWTQPEASWSTR